MSALAEKVSERVLGKVKKHYEEQTRPNDFDDMLYTMYHDQKRIIQQWGVTIPPESELFEKDCPIEAKVMFFDWLIREGLSV